MDNVYCTFELWGAGGWEGRRKEAKEVKEGAGDERRGIGREGTERMEGRGRGRAGAMRSLALGCFRRSMYMYHVSSMYMYMRISLTHALSPSRRVPRPRQKSILENEKNEKCVNIVSKDIRAEKKKNRVLSSIYVFFVYLPPARALSLFQWFFPPCSSVEPRRGRA